MSSLQIAFLNVGQGDTSIIYDLEAREAVIVDCVRSIPIFEFLDHHRINRIRALILTHFHADHYLGTIDLLRNCERRGITWDACILRWDKNYRKMPEVLKDIDGHSEMMIDPNRAKSIYASFLAWIRQEGNKAKIIEPHELPQSIRILRSLKFLHPIYRDLPDLFNTNNLNNLSIVIQVRDGASALLTGDIEPGGWRFLRNNYPEFLKNEIIKFPHHGVWRNGNVSQLLDDVSPDIVVISVGTGNTYGHPSLDVFEEIEKRESVRLLCTQATASCCNSLEEARAEILKLLGIKNQFLPHQSNNYSGCPCAGTVIIELGEKMKVVWPSVDLHANKIIKRYMTTRRCRIP